MPPWSTISELSSLTSVVAGVRSIAAEIAELAKLSWEGAMAFASFATTAGCEIEGERRFSKLVERDSEDKVFLI
jgi:hypothetical protein